MFPGYVDFTSKNVSKWPIENYIFKWLTIFFGVICDYFVRIQNSSGPFHVNVRDVHRSMSWIFFVLSVVVDIDEIYKSWNFERHSPFRFPARVFENLGGSPSKSAVWCGRRHWEGHRFVMEPPQLWKSISRGSFWCRIQIWHQKLHSLFPFRVNEA